MRVAWVYVLSTLWQASNMVLMDSSEDNTSDWTCGRSMDCFLGDVDISVDGLMVWYKLLFNGVVYGVVASVVQNASTS